MRVYVCLSHPKFLLCLCILYLYVNSKFCLGDSGQGRPDKVIPLFLISFSVRDIVCIKENNKLIKRAKELLIYLQRSAVIAALVN